MIACGPPLPSIARIERTKAVIADARHRQQHRRRIAVAILAIASVAIGLLFKQLSSAHSPASAVSSVPLPKPCGLLSNATVSRAIQGAVEYADPEPSDHQCTWAGYPFARQYGQKKIVLSVARAMQAEFERSASYSLVPGPTDGSLVRQPSQPIPNLGQGAYWFANFQDLVVYYHGTVIYLDSVFLSRPLQTEEALARTIMARLDKLSALSRST